MKLNREIVKCALDSTCEAYSYLDLEKKEEMCTMVINNCEYSGEIVISNNGVELARVEVEDVVRYYYVILGATSGTSYSEPMSEVSSNIDVLSFGKTSDTSIGRGTTNPMHTMILAME